MSQTKAQLISDLVQALNFTGTSSAPANGMYLSAANTIKLATNSNGRLTIDSSGNATFTGTCTATTFIGALTGNVTGNASGSAATVTGAAQTAITSVGTLTTLQIGGTTDEMLTLNSTDSDNVWIGFDKAGTRSQLIGIDANNHTIIRNEVEGKSIYLQAKEGGTNYTLATFNGATNSLFYVLDTDAANTHDRKFRTVSSGAIVENSKGDAYLQVIAETDASGNDAVIRMRTYNTTNGLCRIYFADTADADIGRIEYNHTNDSMLFTTNNGTALTITSTQNVGIGTTSPNSRLNLKLSSRGSSDFRITDSDTTNDVLRAGSQADGDGFFQLRTIAGAGNVLFDASGVSYFTGGNLGIGVTSPDQLLHVSDTSNGAAVNPFRLTNTGGSPSTEVRIEFECGLDEIATISAKNEGSDTGPLIFSTATTQSAYPSEKLRITKDGSVGINSTSPHDSSWGTAAQAKFLHIKGPNYGVLSLEGSNGANTKWSMGAGDNRFYMAYNENDAAHALDCVRTTLDVEAMGGNFVLRAAGKGIDFTGGSSVGTAANILDDYEEGTWTIGNVSALGGTSVSVNSAKYTKIGDIVHISFNIFTNSNDMSSGGVTLSGLPFSVNDHQGIFVGGYNNKDCSGVYINSAEQIVIMSGNTGIRHLWTSFSYQTA